MSASDLPTIKEELDRKSLEAIERLILQYRHGTISAEAYEVGLDTLFLTVSGIVSEDFIQMITLAGEEIKKAPVTATETELENVGGQW